MKSKIAVVEGTISDIREVTSTKFGVERKFWVIVIDGKNYFTFTYPHVCIGDYVRLTLKISGGFRDVINIKQIKRTIFDFGPKTQEEVQIYLKNIKEALK